MTIPTAMRFDWQPDRSYDRAAGTHPAARPSDPTGKPAMQTRDEIRLTTLARCAG